MTGSWKRPTIDIPKTKSEKVWDMIGYSYLIGTLLFLVIVWGNLPDQVPAHFNGSGEVDRWGSTWELSILPIISLLLLAMMQFFEKHPEWHNYPARLNESNAKAFYLLSRKMMNILKNICLLILQTIQLESFAIAFGWFNGFGIWFLPAVFIAALLPILILAMKQRKIT
ncbi:DUF1648 domain-containing protein [Neobacillus sp. K501]